MKQTVFNRAANSADDRISFNYQTFQVETYTMTQSVVNQPENKIAEIT